MGFIVQQLKYFEFFSSQEVVQLTSQENDFSQTKNILAEKNTEVAILEEKISQVSNGSAALPLPSVNTPSEDLSNESRDQLTALTERFEACHVASEKEIHDLKRRCNDYDIIESDNEVLEKRLLVLELEVDELNKEKKDIEDRVQVLNEQLENEKLSKENLKKSANEADMKTKEMHIQNLQLTQQLAAANMNYCNLQEDLDCNLEELEKTKGLEQKYFEESSELRSKLEITEEEKKRFQQQIETLENIRSTLEEEKAKIIGHQNHSQKIEHLMALKKEMATSREEIKVLRKQQQKCTCNS